jgi:hypothetical protein
MNEDSPNSSPYETPAKHDQSETKRDITSIDTPIVILCPIFREVDSRL